MFSRHTLFALAKQTASLVPAPSARLDYNVRHAPDRSVDGCGMCPLCHKFVPVEFRAPDRSWLCPRCSQRIQFVDALGASEWVRG